MSSSDEKLSAISQQLKNGVAPQRESVRSFLLWFGFKRRGYRAVRTIRNKLRKHELTTSPDFEWTYIDSWIGFQRAPKSDAPSSHGAESYVDPDPTYDIGRLESANQKPLSVAPDAPIQKVITLMMSNDFSQVPVIQGEREVKGIVSWRTIGERLALKQPCEYARHCMEDAKVLLPNETLFSAISVIASHGYVLVQAKDKTICGMVTASDLNQQFRLLAEPFLLVGEIENGIRRLLHGKFTQQELRDSRAPGDDSRLVETPSDLTFGEYIRLIENESRWKKLRLELGRPTFIEQLQKVKDIRNDVMHFEPDGLEDADLKVLRDFAQFLKQLRNVGTF